MPTSRHHSRRAARRVARRARRASRDRRSGREGIAPEEKEARERRNLAAHVARCLTAPVAARVPWIPGGLRFREWDLRARDRRSGPGGGEAGVPRGAAPRGACSQAPYPAERHGASDQNVVQGLEEDSGDNDQYPAAPLETAPPEQLQTAIERQEALRFIDACGGARAPPHDAWSASQHGAWSASHGGCVWWQEEGVVRRMRRARLLSALQPQAAQESAEAQDAQGRAGLPQLC
ncbi:hypothetical protein T484DRAFT_1972025 [Baffinella frigidus]|nr:hypothetical protein T484DRAFT_1972025 [Cryptophyta sp. CCMP2293]